MIFQNFDFLGCQKGQNDKKALSIVPYISGTIHPMTFIYGAHVSKDNISRRFLYFPKILIFGVNGAALDSLRLAKFCRPNDFFQVRKCLPEGSERLGKQNFHAKKLALFNIRLIACEHLHTHNNKLRCIVDCAPQTVINAK